MVGARRQRLAQSVTTEEEELNAEPQGPLKISERGGYMTRTVF